MLANSAVDDKAIALAPTSRGASFLIDNVEDDAIGADVTGVFGWMNSAAVAAIAAASEFGIFSEKII